LPVATPLATLPLIGRAEELAALQTALEHAGAGRGRTVVLAGAGGIGKTRLAKTLADRAAKLGWKVAMGRAYPVESGVPYALFSDALLPLLRQLDASTLSLLTRGGHADLAYLFPALAQSGDRQPAARGDAAEFKARILWNFTQFLARYAAKHPLLLVLENLQWADASSLELLHFVARQMGDQRILLVCSYNDEATDATPALATAIRSLVSLEAATEHVLQPLSREATAELVQRVFGVESAATGDFTGRLFAWTRGNPFFIEEMLKALIASGGLAERDGTWLGWDVGEFDLPRSIRGAVAARMNQLSEPSRKLANLCAVIGTRASYGALAAVTMLPEPDLLAALDELRAQRILTEGAEEGSVVYDFAHPILQETLYEELGLARARSLHATVAESLERFYGARALARAGELAYHFVRADVGGLAPKAVKYLAAAGRDALAKHANREAADYLAAALDLVDQSGQGAEVWAPLSEDLARARQRLGEYDAAMELWERARRDAAEQRRLPALAAIERRMGLACYWSGRYEEALAHYDAGLEVAREASDESLFARIQLAKGICLQDLGRKADAEEEILGALATAERLGEPALLARVHRALLVVYIWTGDAARAREHGTRAIALADTVGERGVAWSSHWAMAMLAGLTGNAADVAHHVAASERIADELRSPLLRAWTAEVQIEYASGIGDWDTGLALAERTITVARSLGQRTLLPRVLVWSALMYLGRGNLERAKSYLDEAWALSGAGQGGDRTRDVHTVVPAHTGLAAYYLAIGDYRHAIRIGEAGLEIADRSGYVVWAIHRLLPEIGEAALWLQDFKRAERHSARMRRDAGRVGHKLGLAWADACDGLVLMLKDKRPADAAVLLRRAAEELEAIPMVEYAARVRRQLARALVESGDREGAIHELRSVHDVFARLGAERELAATREQLRALGTRPPSRTVGAGAAGLTGREVEIARLVAARKSNKEIGKALQISARTVSTHLSNIFGKLSVGSRGELTDLVRRDGLPDAEG
jgi:DNA-binding NarL/FixJ family response regulator